MRLFTSFLAAITLITLSASASSTIKVKEKDQIIISDGKTSIEVKTPTFETKTFNMSSVVVDQNIVAVDETNCIVYEAIRTSGGYRFNNSYKRSIDLIFNASTVEEGKSYGSLTLYRVTLKDKTSFNLLALTASKKSLKLVYGFDDKAVAALEKDFEQESTVLQHTLESTTERRDHCIKSDWQPKLLIMDGLVGKVRGGF